ncbi:hypothetical protein Tco_0834936 [Tanacetum coccineum]
MTSVGQEVGLSGSVVEAREEVSSKRRFTEMSQHSHWIDLHDMRQLSSKLKAKLMGKRLEEKKVADNIVEEAIVGDTFVGHNFGISNENVVPESVVVPKANVGVEIIIVSDHDGDDDKEVVGDTMDTVVAGTDDDSVAVGMSGFILEACLGAMEGSLEGKRFEEKKVATNIVEEAIVGDTIVGDNFGISNENVVPESVVVPKANVGVEIIIVSDGDGDDDNRYYYIRFCMKSVGQEVGLSGSARDEVSSKRRFTEMSQHSHWIDLHDVRQLSSKLKAKLMGKRFEEKKVADNIVEEAIVGDTIVGDNFGISNENVVPESVVVPKANVGVEIIIVSDGDGDDDKEVVGDTMDTVVAGTDDEIDSVAVGMSGFILEACLGAMEGGSLEATPSGNVKASENVGSPQLIPTCKSQRIQNQKNTCLCIGVTPDYTPEKAVQQASLEGEEGKGIGMERKVGGNHGSVRVGGGKGTPGSMLRKGKPDDEIDSVAVGMSRFILEACLVAMEGGSLEATPSGYVKASENVDIMQFNKFHLKVTWKINCPMSNKVEMWEVSNLFQHGKAKGSRTKRRPEMVTCDASKPEAIP